MIRFVHSHVLILEQAILSLLLMRRSISKVITWWKRLREKGEGLIRCTILYANGYLEYRKIIQTLCTYIINGTAHCTVKNYCLG